MGYASKVAFVLTKEDHEALMEKLNKVDDYILKDFVTSKMTTPDDVYVKTETPWCKWNYGREIVDITEDFLKEVRHSFIRIGEENGDIEVSRKSEDDRGVDEEFEYFLEPIVEISDWDFVPDIKEAV